MTTVAAAAPPQSLTRELVVDAPAMEAWARWTTDEGVRSFFPGAMNGTRIKLERDGPYEFYFLPDNPEGMRGCDGCKILGWQEGKMLSFTWANRPDMAVRPHRTHVVLRFEEIAPDRTRVTLEQDGWGEGDDWRIAYDYFASVWPRVLEAFRASCAESRGQP
jgi:uncharacterized protein YndB with AHSA1/START domain